MKEGMINIKNIKEINLIKFLWFFWSIIFNSSHHYWMMLIYLKLTIYPLGIISLNIGMFGLVGSTC